MAFSSNDGGGDFSEINITPLTDVFLILFLIMIVIAPLINQTALKIDPPKAQYGKAVKNAKVINLEIDSEGMIAINNKKLDTEPIAANEVIAKMMDKGFEAGFPLGRYYAEMENYMIVAVTEKRTKQEILDYVKALGDVLSEAEVSV